VTYFVDGTRCHYLSVAEHATNSGWLDASREYARGPVPIEVVAILSELCRGTTLRTRGWHYCNLCVSDSDRQSVADYVKSVAQSDRGDFTVGSAEVHVRGPSAVTFVAPDMVIHYVVVHGYRPPEDFVKAVLESPSCADSDTAWGQRTE
jgi:hypothetical protein